MSVDFNLVQPLRALLEEVSVSRAAERLHVSQPTMSAALARLRQHFGDELLRREGNRYYLTPLARQLDERSRAALRGMDRLFSAQSDFDPYTSTREFTIVGSDYSVETLAEALSVILSAEAPGVSVRFEQVTASIVNGAPETLVDVDGLLHPHGYLSATDSYVDLFRDRWVCVVASTNSRVGDVLTLDDLARLPWAMSFGSPTQFTPPARQMRMLGIEPRIEMTVPSFLAIPTVLTGTERIAFLQESYARRVEHHGRVRVLECPFEVVPFVEAFWWNSALDHDPEHQWLRRKLAGATEAVHG